LVFTSYQAATYMDGYSLFNLQRSSG